MTGSGLPATEAALAILVAAAVNLAVRMTLAVWLGGKEFTAPAIAGALALAAGAGAYILTTHPFVI